MELFFGSEYLADFGLHAVIHKSMLWDQSKLNRKKLAQTNAVGRMVGYLNLLFFLGSKAVPDWRKSARTDKDCALVPPERCSPSVGGCSVGRPTQFLTWSVLSSIFQSAMNHQQLLAKHLITL